MYLTYRSNAVEGRKSKSVSFAGSLQTGSKTAKLFRVSTTGLLTAFAQY